MQSTYKNQIRARLDALATVQVAGRAVGPITPSMAAQSAGLQVSFFQLILEEDRDSRFTTIQRAAEALGVDVAGLTDPAADVTNLKRWPPPPWVRQIGRRRAGFEVRRHRRIERAAELGRQTGVCAECGTEDILIGMVCQACYARNRRARIRGEAATAHQS